jgi:hypothetical protein
MGEKGKERRGREEDILLRHAVRRIFLHFAGRSW